MSNLIMNDVQQILLIVLQLAVVYGAYLFRKLHTKVDAYLQNHLTNSQVQLLHTLGTEAYSYAETMFKELDGAGKMKQALDYLEGRAKVLNLPFNADVARTVIEKAWLEGKASGAEVTAQPVDAASTVATDTTSSVTQTITDGSQV